MGTETSNGLFSFGCIMLKYKGITGVELTPKQESEIEHYAQGHLHPDVAPFLWRAIKTEVFDLEGFLAAADIIQRNHDALDSELAQQARVDTAWDEDMVSARLGR